MYTLDSMGDFTDRMIAVLSGLPEACMAGELAWAKSYHPAFGTLLSVLSRRFLQSETGGRQMRSSYTPMFVYSILHELHPLNLRLRAICSRLGKKPSESVSSVTVELDCRCDSREAVVEGMGTALVSVKWKLQENDVSTLSSDDIL